MSIERYYGKYIPSCDVCGAELPSEEDFYDAVDAKKQAGWISIRDGVWLDVCPECQETNG